jgi:arylsulfatase A-like enzyme
VAGDERGAAQDAGRRTPLLVLCAGAGLLVGLTEWAVLGTWGLGLSQREIVRTAVAVVVVYGGSGLALGAVAAFLGLGAGRAVGLVPAFVVAAAVALGGVDLLQIAAALALGLVLVEASARLARRTPWVLRPALFWGACALALSGVLAAGARGAPDAAGAVVGWSAAAAIAVLAGAGWLLGRPALHGVAVGGAVACAALLAVRPLPRPEPVVAPRDDRPAVLVITFDTLRSDHVGAYGHADARTDAFDALAQEGVLFRQAVSPSVFTGPSHTSILTGLLPRDHGVLINKMRLSPEIDTLAGRLRRAGYVSGAFVSAYPTLDSACGLPSRFDEYDDDLAELRWLPVPSYRMRLLAWLRIALQRAGFEWSPVYRPAENTADLAARWIERNGGRPFLMWLHLFDPHLPYRPPAAFVPPAEDDEAAAVSGEWYRLPPDEQTRVASTPARVRRMLQLYDAEIAYADAQAGRVIATARRHAPPGGLIVVATSDHGESMGEHGLFWYRDLYDPTLRVPLVIVPPKGAGRFVAEVAEQVRLIDVGPTILDMLGLPAEGMGGASLLPLMRGDADAEPPGPALSTYALDAHEADHERVSVRTDGWKLLRRMPGWVGVQRSEGSEELYDLARDPGELHDLIGTEPAVRERLARQLDTHEAPGPVHRALTPEEEEALRHLGYVR